jgi:hypothetical protein
MPGRHIGDRRGSSSSRAVERGIEELMAALSGKPLDPTKAEKAAPSSSKPAPTNSARRPLSQGPSSRRQGSVRSSLCLRTELADDN